VFWSRYQELPDWEKVIKNIERGEQKIQRQADIMAAIRAKLEQYKNPWQELKVRASVVLALAAAFLNSTC
jgi:SWI/SNF-related matrix-associated actin-dependent regulator of chromatin subfamily A member 5